jgi:hypothetical protein
MVGPLNNSLHSTLVEKTAHLKDMISIQRDICVRFSSRIRLCLESKRIVNTHSRIGQVHQSMVACEV